MKSDRRQPKRNANTCAGRHEETQSEAKTKFAPCLDPIQQRHGDRSLLCSRVPRADRCLAPWNQRMRSG